MEDISLPVLIEDHFQQCVAAKLTLEKAMQSYEVNDDQSNNLYAETIFQGKSPIWYMHKKYRVGSSQIHMVTNAHKGNKQQLIDEALKSIQMEGLKHSTFVKRAMRHGTLFEPIIREIYRRKMSQVHKGFKVEIQGLVVSCEEKFLAVSLDGIASCQCKANHPPRLVEIKAPYRYRGKTIKEIVKNDINNTFIIDHRGQVRIGHRYFDQIQYQLQIMEHYGSADLVLYTGKADINNLKWYEISNHLLIKTIRKDNEYGQEQVHIAKSFLKEHVFPDLYRKLQGLIFFIHCLGTLLSAVVWCIFNEINFGLIPP